MLALGLAAGVSANAHAQKIVDPSTVAPEFREAAEKRRAEQLKQIACAKAAHDQNIAPRERPQFIIDCFDRPNAPPTDISASRPAASDAAAAKAPTATPK